MSVQITGWDESGVGLVLTCPYCQQPHTHILVAEEWTPAELLEAGYGRGKYHVEGTNIRM